MGAVRRTSLGSTPVSPITSTGSMAKLRRTQSKAETARKMLSDDHPHRHSGWNSEHRFAYRWEDRKIHRTLTILFICWSKPMEVLNQRDHSYRLAHKRNSIMSFHSRRSSSFLFLTVLNVNLFLWTKTQNQHLFLLLGHVELDYTFFVFSTTYFFFKAFSQFCIQTNWRFSMFLCSVYSGFSSLIEEVSVADFRSVALNISIYFAQLQEVTYECWHFHVPRFCCRIIF